MMRSARSLFDCTASMFSQRARARLVSLSVLGAALAWPGAGHAQSSPPPDAPSQGAPVRTVLPAPAPDPSLEAGPTLDPAATTAPASPPPQAPPSAAPLPPPGAPAQMPPPAPPPPGAEPPGYYGRYASTEGAYDENTPYDAGSRTHDGFFLRLSVGVGAVLTGYRERVDGRSAADVTTRSLAGLFGVSVGGAVIENLILHGDLQASGFGDAQRSVNGTPDASDRIDGSFVMLGGGATYYFMPTNAYVTLILGATAYSEQRDDEDAVESGVGVGVSSLIGKEWWVGRSAEWGLGGALRFGYYNAPVDIARLESRVSAFDIGLVFGATYN